jgi:TIR domain/Effector-associated domain 11
MVEKKVINVFISYAREDEAYLKELEKHLKPLEQMGICNIFTDGKILPGEEWDGTIKKHLERADVVLFLVSSDLIMSDYIQKVEIKHAVDRARRGFTRVIPIFIRPAMLDSLPISKYAVLPRNGIPVSEWPHLDDAWLDVAKSLRELFVKMSDGTITLNKVPEIGSASKTAFHSARQALEFSKEMRNLVNSGRSAEAFQQVIELFKTTNDDALNDIVLISSRYKSLLREKMYGTITSRDFSNDLNYINQYFLRMLDNYTRRYTSAAA